MKTLTVDQISLRKSYALGIGNLIQSLEKVIKGAIVSMVDRVSKLTKLAICKSKEAKPVTDALTRCLKPIMEFVLTLTADNGKEFANHTQVGQALKANFYFAKPYHSWERGLNEHTNGLVRQYFPKGTSFGTISIEDITKSREFTE